MTIPNDDLLMFRRELELLISNREAMVADNCSRTHSRMAIIYGEDDFHEVAIEISGIINRMSKIKELP